MTIDELRQKRKFRTPEAAAYCQMGKSTFDKLRLYGGGCVYSKIGRVCIYDRDDLDAWLAEHKRKSTSDLGQNHGGSQ